MERTSRSGRIGRRIVAGASLAVGLTTGVMVATGGPTVVAELPLAGRWEMNEGSSATTMHDSGPFGLDGSIGAAVGTGGGDYSWSHVSPTAPPAKPERLVLVDSDWRLEPGSAEFEISFRYKTNRSYGNVIQKGQNGAPGGYWKFEQPNGRMTCLFKDQNGKQRAVKAKRSTNDNRWHTIRCTLRDDGIRIYIDGEFDQMLPLDSPMGPIGNGRPMSIGGKSNCNQVTITCDYFVGSIDWVEIRHGAATPPTTSTSTTTSTTTTLVGSGPPVPTPWTAEVTTPARRGQMHELVATDG